MPIYQWAGITRKGRKLKGEIDAANEKMAMANLKKRNLTVKKLKPKSKDLFANVSFLKPKVTKKDLVIFTRQFSTMIDAGLPAGPGSSDPVRAVGKPHLQRNAERGHQGRGRGIHPGRGAQEAPRGLRQPLREPDRGRRGGRYSGYHSPPPVRVYREGGETQEPDQGGHDLPHRGGGHCHHRDRGHPDLRDPRFPGHVQEFRQGPACTDTIRGDPERFLEGQHPLVHPRASSPSSTWQKNTAIQQGEERRRMPFS